MPSPHLGTPPPSPKWPPLALQALRGCSKTHFLFRYSDLVKGTWLLLLPHLRLLPVCVCHFSTGCDSVFCLGCLESLAGLDIKQVPPPKKKKAKLSVFVLIKNLPLKKKITQRTGQKNNWHTDTWILSYVPTLSALYKTPFSYLLSFKTPTSRHHVWNAEPRQCGYQ